MEKQHTFVICAYQKSEYLEECIRSLMRQTVKSEILMATSTPNPYIKKVSEKYAIPLYVNTGERGITQDWNFAYRQAKTPLVTIAHQDDVYAKNYTELVLEYLKKSRDPLLLFTDYGELRDGVTVLKNHLLQIKRAMLQPLRIPLFRNSIFVRRRILSLGDPICCPAVTFCRERLPEEIFTPGFRSDEDWEAWERLSRMKGAFVFIPSVGMLHRIHQDSETSAILGDHARNEEDYQMFRKFWPRPIARFLANLYSKSEQSNNL